MSLDGFRSMSKKTMVTFSLQDLLDNSNNNNNNDDNDNDNDVDEDDDDDNNK